MVHEIETVHVCYPLQTYSDLNWKADCFEIHRNICYKKVVILQCLAMPRVNSLWIAVSCAKCVADNESM